MGSAGKYYILPYRPIEADVVDRGRLRPMRYLGTPVTGTTEHILHTFKCSLKFDVKDKPPHIVLFTQLTHCATTLSPCISTISKYFPSNIFGMFLLSAILFTIILFSPSSESELKSKEFCQSQRNSILSKRVLGTCAPDKQSVIKSNGCFWLCQ